MAITSDHEIFEQMSEEQRLFYPSFRSELSVDPERYAYHFTKFDTAREYIIGGDRTVRLGQLKNANDLTELLGDALQTDLSIGDCDSIQVAEFDKSVVYAARNHVRVFCASKDTVEKRNDTLCMTKGAGIRRGFELPRMWAQYGEDNAGVCLIIDRNALSKKIAEIVSPDKAYRADVKYGDRSPRGSWTTPDLLELSANERQAKIIELLQTWAGDCFYFKDSDWANEREYRWCFVGELSYDLHIPVDNKIVVGVVVGFNRVLDEARHFEKICNEFGTPSRRIHYQQGRYDPENISGPTVRAGRSFHPPVNSSYSNV